MKFMKNSNKITSSLSLPSLVISRHCFFFHCFCTVVYIVYVCYVYHCEHTKRAIHFLSCSKIIWCKYTLSIHLISEIFVEIKTIFFPEIFCYFCEIGDCFQQILLVIDFAQTLAPSKFLLGNHAKRKRS